MALRTGIFAFIFLLSFGADLQSQGLALTPLNNRHTPPSVDITTIATLNPDTLILPFFDDFTFTTGYPSFGRWVDKEVWVNNTFPINPPNYNVATFDHLNAMGKPYTTLNKNSMVYADSLTSVPIKLDFYKTGPTTTKNYLPTDSIYLSFFYQRMGLGDAPEAEDSLILFFRRSNGAWKRVWAQIGGAKNDFEIVVVPIDSFSYLYNSFQFRFVNYTKSTGNLNHWHIDYVRLEKYKGRVAGFDLYNIRDIGIVKPRYTYLNTYFSLPKSHYETDIPGLTRSSDPLIVRNLNPTITAQTRYARKVFNQYNDTDEVDFFPFTAAQNTPSNSNFTFTYDSSIRIDTFSGKNPCYTVTHYILPQSTDNTPDEYYAEGNNNSITVEHCFTPWYAYDDGSAEGGFGLDYAHLGNIKGQFAMKFNNLKEDSLRGLAIYFNRSESDVSFRSFYLRIWRSLTPLGNPDNQDVLLYEQFVDHPMYTDSINHFAYIFFDTVLIIPQGEYYVGWRQNQPFILNVGYDNNYRYQDQETGNPNLFHNLLGSWERSDVSIKGTPMIRPMLGADLDYTFKVKKTPKPEFTLYPNPVNNTLRWTGSENIRRIQIFDLSGRSVRHEEGNSLQSCDVQMLSSGTYFVVLTSSTGKNLKSKFIKN